MLSFHKNTNYPDLFCSDNNHYSKSNSFVFKNIRNILFEFYGLDNITKKTYPHICEKLYIDLKNLNKKLTKKFSFLILSLIIKEYFNIN